MAWTGPGRVREQTKSMTQIFAWAGWRTAPTSSSANAGITTVSGSTRASEAERRGPLVIAANASVASKARRKSSSCSQYSSRSTGATLASIELVALEHAQDGSFVVAVPDHTDRSLHRDVKRVVVCKPLRGRASRFLVQGRSARPNSVAGSRARENTPMRGRRHQLDQAQSRRTPDGSPGQDPAGAISMGPPSLFTSPVVIFDGSAYAFDDGAPGGGAMHRTGRPWREPSRSVPPSSDSGRWLP